MTERSPGMRFTARSSSCYVGESLERMEEERGASA
jgi:hypothetical protein